jgi:pyrroline-5-carboxylate reductase
MEAMIKAGQALGLDEKTARALTLQTALGAAQMAITSDVPPAELRRRVTSKGGTTERAIATHLMMLICRILLVRHLPLVQHGAKN